jgi:ribosome biogenesis protein SSF1/2
MPRVGGKRRKTRTHATGAPQGAVIASQVGTLKEDSTIVVPRSIVAKGNKVIPMITELIRDMRRLMSPNTATNLREKNYNRMKDYCAVAGMLGVSHLLVISQTEHNIVLRISRFENGPTLHFHIQKYCLARHIRASQKKPHDSASAYLTSPLVVLNNFGKTEDSHVKLMAVTLQHMFPSINIKSIRLGECRRVVLFNYLKESGLVEMRHYYIRAAPVGISRSVKKILQAKIPDLGNLSDISQFIEGQGMGAASDSEAEDESTRVILPDKFVGHGNSKSQQSSIKLSEVGPRLTLELFKVERGLCEGDVLYHKYESKSADEAAKLKQRVRICRNSVFILAYKRV